MFQKYMIKISGINPLIMHWDNINWADQMSAFRTRIKSDTTSNEKFKAGDDRCPPDTWKGCIYSDIEGLISIPSDNLRACLVRAGAKVPVENSRESFKKAMASGILFDLRDIPLSIGGKFVNIAKCEAVSGNFLAQFEAVKDLGFELLVKRAKVGMAKHVRVRPMLRNWSLEVLVTVTEERITQGKLQEIWTNAGLYVGLGDWRPDSPKSPGPHGTFKAEVFPISAKKVA